LEKDGFGKTEALSEIWIRETAAVVYTPQNINLFTFLSLKIEVT
jgi:hypothetical protein